MSIRLAFTFEMFNQLKDLTLKDNGFYNLNAYNAFAGLTNQAWKPILTPQGITSNNVSQSGNCWFLSGSYTLINPNSGYMYIGARAYGFKTANVNSSPLVFIINGTAYHLFNGTAAIFAAFSDESYIELVVDRYLNIITAYVDGVQVNQVAMSAAQSSAIATAGWAIGVAMKAYAGTQTYMDDVIVVESDSGMPNTRLGAVRLTARPVVVKAINGFDVTDIAAAQAKLGTVLTNGATSGLPTNKAPIKASLNGATIDFSIDVGSTPAARQIGVTLFAAGIRNSANMANAMIEGTLDGVTKTIYGVSFATKGADQYNWTAGGYSARGSDNAARSINDISFRLKVVES